MKTARLVVAFAVTSMALKTAHADSLGVAAAYNLVALNGNITVTSDVGGRVAASGQINANVQLGSGLSGNDPEGSLAGGYLFVAGADSGSSSTTQLKASGNVFASGSNASHFSYQNPATGSETFTGSSPITFSTLFNQLDTESLYLTSLASTGTIGGTDSSCGSCLKLTGTSTALNVFNLTAAQLSSANNPLDIYVPSGSTVVINVAGTSDSLGAGFYINGQQVQQTGQAGADILFNLSSATSVSINGTLGASLLAPLAAISGNSVIDGTVIGSSINVQGEVHNNEFTGTLPAPVTASAPEPGSLALLGTGVFGVAGLLRRRMKA